MCTAYELGKRGGSFPEHIKANAFKHLIGLDATRIIRPTLLAPVILPDGTLREMAWGFRRPVPGGKTKQLWRTIVNSREDKLQGRTWHKAFTDRRCLIPATAFYEWIDRRGGKVPLRFEDPTGAFLWIAGIWEHDQERGDVFSMITTEPSAQIAPVHDRMPAVLVPENIGPFLSGQLNAFGPSQAPLAFAEAANFLKKPKPAAAPDRPSGNPLAPPDQGTLF